MFRQGANYAAITNDQLTITLTKGQSFVLEYPIAALPGYFNSTSLTPAQVTSMSNTVYDEWMGASIVSDKDIVVSLGNALYSNFADANRDLAIDQIIPENVLGSEYVFVRGFGKDQSEYPIIIATQNGTEIYINDALTPAATIDAGEYYIVSGSNFSGTNETTNQTRKGENLYVRTSKQVYAYQSTAGSGSGSSTNFTIDYNFIAPVNFLLEKEVNFIPDIEKVANVTIAGGISIVSAAATPDAQVIVKVNGVTQSLAGKRKSVNGTSQWVTYFLDGLSGNVSVTSTGSIAVGYSGQSVSIGVSGYFSGFSSVPSIDVDVAVVGECLQTGNVTLSAPTGYAIYQWYLEGEPVSGATQRTFIPSLPGSYTVGITTSGAGQEYVSAPVDVSDCNPEIKIDVTSAKQSLGVGESVILKVNHKFQSYFNATAAEVTLVIPSNFQIDSNNPSVGTWSNTTKKWTIGTISPGSEEVLELTLTALSIGNPLVISATNSQTVLGTNGQSVPEGTQLADDLTESFTIKTATVITAASSISKTVLDPDFSIGATSNNPGSINYSSNNEGVAKVGPTGIVDFISAGTATLTLTQAETSTYAPGIKTITVTVSKITPTLSAFPNLTKTFGDPAFQLVAPSSTGDGAITYTSSDVTVATVNSVSGQTTILKAGSTTITANQAATSNYNAASIALTLTVNKASQSINVSALPEGKTVLERVGPGASPYSAVPLSATSTSGSSVIVSLPSGSIGTLTGSVGNYSLTNVSGPGNLVINFDVPASTNYNAESASVSLDVSKRPQNITVNAAMPTTAVFSVGLSIPITATAPSSAAMSYAIVEGPATILNGEIKVTGAGLIKYSINNPGDNIYTEAPEIIRSLTVTQGSTILSNFTITDRIYGEANLVLPIPNSNRTGDFIYTSSASTVASISGNYLVINTPGSVTITATQTSTANWTAQSIPTTFQVLKATPILSGITSVSKLTTDPNFDYSVTSTAPSLPIVFRSSNLSVATVNSSTGSVEIQGIGTTQIIASQAATTNYNAASLTLTLTVQKANPTLGAVPEYTKFLGDANFSIAAPSSTSGGSFGFSSSNPNVVYGYNQ